LAISLGKKSRVVQVLFILLSIRSSVVIVYLRDYDGI
jgi:hypothetical protein